ncbi:hypothetical protein [Virgibacillus ihumii]|uniref:hypothetical protein n=1 Tax=Virgibacillus ihumii TaxID=2686091 RepID=UPI00157C6677|nr:hypothetical protein [Virgibacillus ihumii]
MSGLIKKVLVSLAIIFVIFQPVLTPLSYAVGPWEGNTWEGNPWEGNSWDGNNLKWSGNTWSGDSWEGNSWDGDSLLWSGNPWEGKSWEGNGTNGNGTNGNGTAGNGTNGDGTNGNGTEGNGTSGNGTNGNGTEGNGTNGSGTNGNGTNNDIGLEEYPKLPQEYNVGKYILNDVVMGQAKLIGDFQTYQNLKDLGYNPKFNYGGRFYSNLLMNGVKLGVGNNAINSMYDTYTHVADGVKGVQDFRTARKFATMADNAQDVANTADSLRDAANVADNFTPPAAPVGALSKLNVAAAVVGTGVSAFETGYKGAKAYDVLTSDASGAEKTSAVADATASLGNTLMNAGVVTSAIPGGQAIGAGMVAVGAGIWVVSKGVKLFADNWKGNLWDTGKHLAKKAGNAIKNVASSAWDTVTGWF